MGHIEIIGADETIATDKEQVLARARKLCHNAERGGKKALHEIVELIHHLHPKMKHATADKINNRYHQALSGDADSISWLCHLVVNLASHVG